MQGRFAFVVAVLALSALPAWAQGPSITLAWDPPLEGAVAGYRVYVGTRSGVYSESYDVGSATLFTYDNATAGRRYYFAVSAYGAGALEGPRSSAVSTTPRVATTPRPPAARGVTRTAGTGVIRSTPRARTTAATATPVDETGPGVVLQPPLISGSSVSLQWSPIGISVVEYAIEAGTESGSSNLYNASVGHFTSIRANVGDGVYFVRVRARLGDDSTATSNEVSFSIGSGSSGALRGGCSAPPTAPPFVDGFVDAGMATVNWDDAGGATSYLVQAGTAPGLSNLFHGNVGATTSVAAPVPPGFTAYVRVIGVNACGQSVASSEIFVQ